MNTKVGDTIRFRYVNDGKEGLGSVVEVLADRVRVITTEGGRVSVMNDNVLEVNPAPLPVETLEGR